MSPILTKTEVESRTMEIIQHPLKSSTGGLTLEQIAADESICFYVGITKMFDIINNNIKNINSIKDHQHSNIHIIIGSLYDPIIDNKIIDSIDINPILKSSDNHKKQYEYIYFYLHNYNNNIKEDILEYVKKLNIEVIDAKINTNVTYTENQPYEMIFKLAKKN
jgi:hypothetical protein